MRSGGVAIGFEMLSKHSVTLSAFRSLDEVLRATEAIKISLFTAR